MKQALGPPYDRCFTGCDVDVQGLVEDKLLITGADVKPCNVLHLQDTLVEPGETSSTVNGGSPRLVE
jgi:hypothetical protein